MAYTRWQRATTFLSLIVLLFGAAAWGAPLEADGTLDFGGVRSARDQGGGGIEPGNGAQCRLFGDPSDYSTGDFPYSVAVGDFDGDDVLDLAVTNGGSANVSVLLGLGDGSFAGHQLYGVGEYPNEVTVGDFDDDGAPDLAVANWNSGNVSVLLGLGDGSFAGQQLYDVGESPRSVAVGDFNDNGAQDLVVGRAVANNVQVLRGLGDGSFDVDPPLLYGVGDYPISVAVGEFDGDGAPDLAVANFFSFPNEISVLLGLGAYRFTPEERYGTGSTPVSVAVGQFDGDGIQDLAVANQNSEELSVLAGVGDGTFGAEQRFDSGFSPASIAVGDFDDDGVQDLVVANLEDDVVSVLLGLGDGTFAAKQSFEVGAGPRWVAVGDFDGDGAQDLAVTNTDADTVSILINRCSRLVVDIDIKPHSYPNSINPRSRGVIPVAILGSESFDVADVDVATLRFGPDAAPIAHRRGHLADVNYDGLMDLVSHYGTRASGIACGDRSARLTGQTLDGQSFEGSGSVRTVACRYSRRGGLHLMW